jgi:predicted HTH transcriptional regulator
MKRLNEDITVEYKEDIPKKPIDLKREIVSFLNTSPGGIIYLGIDDNGNKVEFTNEEEEFKKKQQWESLITNWISDGFAPNVRGLIEVRPNVDVFTILVHSGPDKPYYYTDGKGMNNKGVWIRSGSTKRRASDEEIRNMIFGSSRKPFDLEESAIQDLTFTNLINKLSEESINFDERSLRLKATDNSYYNNAAYAFSEQNESVTKLAIYDGLDTINFRDKQNFTGSIIRQINDILSYVKLVNTTPAVITGEAKRQERSSYPEEAIREAVINAFAHRDYNLPADIRIEFFDNRLEVHSPGPIYGGLSVKDIMDGSNARRNPTIVHVLDKIDYMENFGSGIRRIYSLYSEFNKIPKISATENSFKITLYNRNYLLNQVHINNEMLLIIEYLSNISSASRKDIQEHIQLSKWKTIDLLNILISENIVIKKGKSVSTLYSLK